MKQTLLVVLLSLISVSASATMFTDRSTFESSIGIAYTENFQTLSGTHGITGPITMPTGLVVSSSSNDLYSVGPGQSTNPTEAIGSNFPPSDYLFFALGGSFNAFGADFFQNFGVGTQGSVNDTFQLGFFNSSTLVDAITGSVAPNGGSFIGYVSSLGSFDSVGVLSLSNGFEVADNVTVGNPSNSVPEPTSIALLGLGLAGLGFFRRRRTDSALVS